MDTIMVVNKCYELYKITTLINNDLSKRIKYSLGFKIENNLLDCLEHIIMAKNAIKPHKAVYILRAISKSDILRLQLRLLVELKLLPENKSYTKVIQAQSLLVEIGKMLGGWLKACNAK